MIDGVSNNDPNPPLCSSEEKNPQKPSIKDQLTQDLIESVISNPGGEDEAGIDITKIIKIIAKGAKWAYKHGKEIAKVWFYSKIIDKLDGCEKKENKKKDSPSPTSPQQNPKEEEKKK